MPASSHPHVVLEPFEPSFNAIGSWGHPPYRQIRIRAFSNAQLSIESGNYLGIELLKELHVALGEFLAKESVGATA